MTFPVTVTDGRGEVVSLATPPQRVVSLVPSTTESLFALGCGDRVVGVTRFCVHPATALRGVVRVGGTKDLELERLRALCPDLVIGNVEENTRAMFADITREGFPLYAAFPRTVEAALSDLLTLGGLVGAEAAATQHHARIQSARAMLRGETRGFRYAYLIWRRPWMAINGETFIASLLAEAGGVNVFATHEPRYFALDGAALAAAQPDVVLLSSEPFPFQERHRAELAAESGLPVERFALVDGELCSWHGVRMGAAFGYLERERASWVHFL